MFAGMPTRSKLTRNTDLSEFSHKLSSKDRRLIALDARIPRQLKVKDPVLEGDEWRLGLPVVPRSNTRINHFHTRALSTLTEIPELPQIRTTMAHYQPNQQSSELTSVLSLKQPQPGQ